jgi:uncharacterized protein
MKNKLLLLGVMAAILAGCVSGREANQNLSQQKGAVNSNYQSKYQDHQTTMIKIGETSLEVELAMTEQSTTQGLSGRQTIGADGMLFIFPTTQVRHFWMKEMLFPIDIIWIKDHKIVGLSKNVLPPEPGTPLAKLPTYPSPVSVNMVLEVPAGFADQHNLSVGSPLTLE